MRTLVAHLANAAVIFITALVRRHAERVIARARHALATLKLAHLGARTGAALKVSVAADRGECARSGGEVVVRNGVERGGAVTRSERVVAVAGLEGAVRCSREAAVPRETIIVIVGRLPVDGGHAIVEVLGRAKLPLAEERPRGEDQADGSSYRDDHDERGLRDLLVGTARCGKVGRSTAGRRSRGLSPGDPRDSRIVVLGIGGSGGLRSSVVRGLIEAA